MAASPAPVYGIVFGSQWLKIARYARDNIRWLLRYLLAVFALHVVRKVACEPDTAAA